jgi:hypothetical protein
MKKAIAVVGFVLMVLATSPAYAIDIQLGVGDSGTYILGEAFSHMDLNGGGSCGAECRESTIVNVLIGRGTNTRTVRTEGSIPEYYRSANIFSPLPATTEAEGFVRTSFTTSGDWVKITITRPYLYLVAAYDGKNTGAEAWYIGDISGGNTLWIPKDAYRTGTAYTGTNGGYSLVAGDGKAGGLTSWSVWSPVTVPDGGTTAALLGLALVGLGFARRFKG